MRITNCVQLWTAYGGWLAPMEERSKQLLEKSIFKHTQCGCVFDADEDGVILIGYAEGSDAWLPPHTLDWGFTMDEFNAALAQADEEGVEEWERANEYDLVRVVEEEDPKSFGGALKRMMDKENYEDHKDRDE
jgi:hypothetical protein